MSDNIFAYYDADRDAVILRLESGSEVGVLARDDAASLASETLAASMRQSTGYEEFLAQERGEDTDEQPDTDAVPYLGYATDDPRYDEAAQQEFKRAGSVDPESTYVVLARFLVRASKEDEASGQITTDLSAHPDVDEVWAEAEAG